MRGFGFSQACACVVLLASLVNLGAATDLFNGQQNYRVLHAATKRADLQRRSMRITKKFEAELSYIEDENGWSGKSTFASQVRVFSKKPITNLEEIEHHLKDVQCRDGKMKLHFVDKSSARDAFHSCHGANGGLIITSHQGCNAEGERTVYKVHDVSFADYDQNLELSTTRVLFQDAFDGIDVAFGHTTDDHLFRRHEIFAKVHGKPHVAYHRRDDKNKLVDSFKLDAQLINKSFSLEEFKVGLKPGARTLDIPAIGCKNCTTKGSMSLSHGAFSLDLSPFDEIKDEILSKVPEVVSKIPEIVSKVPEIVTKIPIPKITELPKIPDFFKFSEEVNTNGIKDIKNVIKGGSFELSTSGISAHLDMFAKPKESGEFEILLFKVPVLGFSIPGIGQAGAVFEPRIVADFETSEALEISYGIDVTIPDKANLVINIANIPDSKANGFADSKLTPLPIRTNATNIDIDLGLAFKPTIPIGFEFTEKFKAEASVSMQLPRLDVKLSSDTEEYCDADFEGDGDEEEDEADEDEEEDETEENDEEDETDDTEEDTEDTEDDTEDTEDTEDDTEDTEDTEDAEDTEDTDEKDETDETDPTDEKDETDEAEDEETEPEETDETDPTDEDGESDQTDEKDESEETGDTDESDESDELDDPVEADPTDDTKEDEETEESDEIDEADEVDEDDETEESDETDETDETEEADEADDVDEDEDDMEDTADAKRRFRRATPKPLLVVSADLSIAIEVGIDIKFSLPKGPLPQIPPVQKTATLFSTAKPLVTSCATPEEAFKSLKNIIASALPNKAATPTLRARSDPMLEHACRVPLGNGTEEIRWPANSTHNASVSNQAHDGPVPMFSLLPLCNTTSSGVGPSNNGTVAPSGGPITITSTVRATGSLSPSTQAPSAPVTQTSSPAPSSAAVRGEALKGSGWWWQLCVVGVSLAMGVLVVL